jgi:GDP-L-fucose synthase
MTDMRNRRITVTGGKGFLGAHLLRELDAKGCRRVSVADLPE